MTGRRRERLLRVSLLIALVGLAEWGFGNIYEQVVLAPNFAFGDAHAGLVAYHAFFQRSNPVYYYVPANLITIAALAIAVFAGWSGEQRRVLLASAACVALAVLLTVYVVTQINLRIFFGPLPADPDLVATLARRWFALNGVRVLLALTGFILAARALPTGSS